MPASLQQVDAIRPRLTGMLKAMQNVNVILAEASQIEVALCIFIEQERQAIKAMGEKGQFYSLAKSRKPWRQFVTQIYVQEYGGTPKFLSQKRFYEITSDYNDAVAISRLDPAAIDMTSPESIAASLHNQEVS